MTYEQAIEIQKKYQKHSPWVRLTEEQQIELNRAEFVLKYPNNLSMIDASEYDATQD